MTMLKLIFVTSNNPANVSALCERTISKTYTNHYSRKETGATLFTAIIFLVMLSMLGVNAAQMTNLEERMAGNNRSRDLAFQAAEAALKHVENNLGSGENIRALIPAPTDNATGTVINAGLRTIKVCLPNNVEYWNGTGAPDCNGDTRSFVWSNNTARLPNGILNHVAVQPMYIVERFANDGLLEKYRVTARGVGGDTDAVVILQAIFTYQP
jgi:type IV pilus assembly protein PilX